MLGISHKEAKNYLESYLARKSDQGMAVLIDGHWGAGKTWFVTSFFEERRRRLSKSRGEGQAPDYLYASFFGAPDEAAVADQFLSQLYPALNSKLGKVLGTAAFRLGSALFKSTSQIDNPIESSDVGALREWAAHPGDRIVVFDDLERAGISVERALALINGYVERDGIRVIVIANELEIKSEKYRSWKEKVIGKTLFVCADADEVLMSIAREIPSGAVKSYLTSHRVKIADIVRASKYPNYRSVKNLISDVHRVVLQLDGELAASSVVVESLVRFSVGIGAEFRAGTLAAAEILGQARLYVAAQDTVEKSRMKEVQEIYSKYENLGASECIVPANFLIDLWSTGKLQSQAIHDALRTDPRVVGEAATPPWRRLWTLWDLGRSSYERARKDALELLKENGVTIEGEILHIVGAALQVEDFGADFFPDESALDWLRSYLQREEVRSKLTGTSIYDRRGSSSSYAGLGFTGYDLPAFEDARKLITAALLEIDEERKLARLDEYVERLRCGDYEPISLSGNWNESIPFGAWLHLLDPKVFVSVLIEDGRIIRGLSTRMTARYESDSFGGLQKEWAWLRQVRALTVQELSVIPEPYRTISWRALRRAQSSIRGAVAQAERRQNIGC